MTITPVVPSLYSQIIQATRRELDDKETDNYNNARDVTALRYNENDVIEAINDALINLGNIMALNHSGEALTYTDTTYTGDGITPSDLPGLPATLFANQIFGIMSMVEPTYPVVVTYVSPREFLEKVKGSGASPTAGKKFYTLMGSALNTASVGGGILMGPSATGTPIRIWYVQTPFIAYDTGSGVLTDQILLSSRWREIIALKAALILMSRNGEFNQQLELRLADEMRLFTAWSNRQHGPKRIRLVNRPF